MISESADRIEAYTFRSGPDWSADDMAVDAISKRLEEIGELAKRLSPETLTDLSTVDWRGVKGMREVLVHDYDAVDVDLVRDILETELPELRSAIEAALRSTNSRPDPIA